jgi:hypothetical protein
MCDFCLQAANNDGLKVGETVTAWVWDRIQPDQPIKLQKPKQAWGKDKSDNDNTNDKSAGQQQAAVSLRKPWITVGLGKK